AAEHGAEVRPVDVNQSEWDCTLERGRCDESPALRLGMRLVKGLRVADAERIVAAVRARGRFGSLDSLRRASGASVPALKRLAAADAFGSMGLDRQAALWHVRALRDEEAPIF